MDVVIDTGSGGLAQPLRRLGKYELFARIAAGGMAEVYLARQRGPMNFTKVVVVKVIHPHLASQPEFLQMLLDEARLSAAIKHPRVVDVYEFGRSKGIYFMAMEYLDGQPLSSVLQEGLHGERLDPLSSARIVADAAEGLHAAHELRSGSGANLGLVHRDVSPGNIMVLYDGTAKIVDFGIAKARGRISVSSAHQFKGKLGYVAPEQIEGAAIDRRADVFGLGVVLWESLAVRRLYAGESDRARDPRAVPLPPSPSSIHPDVPDGLSDICLRALATDPEKRFQTAGDMQIAIDEVLHRAGYYRELGAIRDYMERVFGGQRESRQRRIRRLGDITGEVPLAGGDSQVEIEVDYPEPALRDDRMASGTPVGDAISTVSELRPPRRRRRIGVWGLLGFGLLAGFAATVIVQIAMTELDRDRAAAPRQGSHAANAPVLARAVEHTASQPAEPPPAAPPDQPHAATTGGDAKPASEQPEPGSKPPEPASDSRRSHPRPAENVPHDAPEPTRTAAQLYDEGAELFVQGKSGEAKKRFKQALEINSRYAPAYRGLGLIYTAEGKNAKAVASFRRYVQLRPSASDAASVRKRIEQLEQ